MKVCKYCGLNKNELDFEIMKVVGDKIYRRLKCKICKQATQRERRQRCRDWINDYKKNKKCNRCGFSDYRALCFHHKDSTQKETEIAVLAQNGASIKHLQREIDKCEVICGNCHMIEHNEYKPS